ncbi:MAG: sugar phosphate isomerase/epimerase [Gammaproteobacteria bacterium]|nr:sugar phosphate isomerase/epimerase [Gammaproteobacteria bacterium]
MINLSQSRRQFLKKSSVASLMVFLPTAAIQAQDRKVNRIGLQLYSLRNEMASDFDGTLQKVADLGYTEMQFAGYHGRSPEQVKKILDQLGLESPAAHVSLELIKEDLDNQIDIAQKIGQKYLVVPSIPADERTLSHYEKHAETLNMAGEKCKDAGLTIAYHNHSFEFETQNNETGYEYLLSLTDTSLVSFELDLYWAINANVDPISIFKKNPGRFPMVHVKDRNTEGQMVDVGRGVIDFSEIFSHSETAGIQHYFVEHDYPDDGINSIAYSYETVSNINF